MNDDAIQIVVVAVTSPAATSSKSKEACMYFMRDGLCRGDFAYVVVLVQLNTTI